MLIASTPNNSVEIIAKRVVFLILPKIPAATKINTVKKTVTTIIYQIGLAPVSGNLCEVLAKTSSISISTVTSVFGDLFSLSTST